jgi:hypothetical protein
MKMAEGSRKESDFQSGNNSMVLIIFSFTSAYIHGMAILKDVGVLG